MWGGVGESTGKQGVASSGILVHSGLAAPLYRRPTRIPVRVSVVVCVCGYVCVLVLSVCVRLCLCVRARYGVGGVCPVLMHVRP